MIMARTSHHDMILYAFMHTLHTIVKKVFCFNLNREYIKQIKIFHSSISCQKAEQKELKDCTSKHKDEFQIQAQDCSLPDESYD